MKSISLKNRKIKLHKQCKQIVYDNYTVQWEPFARESSVSLQTSKIYMSSPTHTHNTTLHLFIINSTWMRAACKHSQVHIQIPMRIHAYSNQVQSSLAVILIVLSSSLFLFLNICIRSNGEGERESIIYKRSSFVRWCLFCWRRQSVLVLFHSMSACHVLNKRNDGRWLVLRRQKRRREGD